MKANHKQRVFTFGDLISAVYGVCGKRRAPGIGRLTEYPLAIADDASHVGAVACTVSTFGKDARSTITEATELDDAATAGLFTEISRRIDKWLWFVEAHSQASK